MVEHRAGTAYTAVAKANKKAHRNNQRFYDRKTKTCHFEVNGLVYLYTPALEAGQTKKFQKIWSGPYKISRKISELNYEIFNQDDKKIIVHVYQLKKWHSQSLWEPRRNQKTKRTYSGESEEEEIRVSP